MNTSHKEYRAVFSYPSSFLGPSKDTYGPHRQTREEAERDYPQRSEENHGWNSGTQERELTDWH